MTARVSLDGDQLIARRHLDAEPALVWEAFTTPEHLAAFWGGDHATVAPGSVVVDLRVGGTFRLETRGADGAGRPLIFRYEVVEPPTRLVLSEPRTGITTDIRLEPDGTGTAVVVHQRRLPPRLRTEQARTGLAGILDRLDAVLTALTSDPRRSAP
ncbi:SRPBCC family protein [Jiangella rhizosphaerae]|uniref:SRPBCC domain-containing protein n=1 Tax=Jiangella rhizosphaerae TaxID=2293569 RepID=A0A418KM92_9ACTN|nr:SRPBCC domain-containing protein [Jiangella rhizosphaerae]RIQ19505.1 SRPBCC domain-containing protein [Jiangella rhizosphaerae]